MPRLAGAERFARCVAEALADPGLHVFEFIALARTLSALGDGWAFGMIRKVERWLVDASLRDLNDLDTRVATLLSELESNTQLHTGLFCGAGRSRGAIPQSVERSLGEQTGYTIPQLRHAIMVKRAIPRLARTDEHVRQIAFQVGYAHASECDRDFRRVLKMTPKTYRRILRGESS